MRWNSCMPTSQALAVTSSPWVGKDTVLTGHEGLAQRLRKGRPLECPPGVPMPAGGMTRSTADPPGRQRPGLDLPVQPPHLLPVMGACLSAGLLGAVGQQHRVAAIEAGDERPSGLQPAVRCSSEVSDAVAAVGREGEEVGHDGTLEAEDVHGLLHPGRACVDRWSGMVDCSPPPAESRVQSPQ